MRTSYGITVTDGKDVLLETAFNAKNPGAALRRLANHHALDFADTKRIQVSIGPLWEDDEDEEGGA